MALMAAGSDTEPAIVCQKLETFVRQKMRHSAFSTSLLPADEVARTLKGDCTEHAVLLATLIRTRGIPARIASGLIHTNRQLGFTGHVWVEAEIHDSWEPFDSAVDASAPETTRIKLSDSQMPDTLISGASLFVPILELAGRSHVQILQAR
jgi:transglutaminase-like putative cysteine protease